MVENMIVFSFIEDMMSVGRMTLSVKGTLVYIVTKVPSRLSEFLSVGLKM